jgi:hypothetical protein
MRKADTFLWLVRTASILALTACSSGSNDGASAGDPAAGKAAGMKYGCPACHSQDLSGTTTPYATTMTYPANLTPDKDTGLADWDADTIKTALLTGKDDEGKQLCSVMPVFSKMNMTDTEANDIAAYLKSLPAVKKDVPESACGGVAAGGGAAGAAGK